jgi:hypothetical protein
MSSCHHHGRNDGGATSEGETLDKTHNNQSLKPNGVAATDYKGYRDVVTPLDAPLLGLDIIHGSKPKIRCHRIWIGSEDSTSFINSGRLRFQLDMRPVPLEI